MDSAKPYRIAFIAGLLLAGVCTVEAVNTMRMWSGSQEHPQFPQDYLSRGIYSAYALVRPLDATSTDFAPSVRAAQALLAGNQHLYAEFDEHRSSFIYPPSAALLLAPFGWVGNAFGEGAATRAMDALGRLCVALLVVIACVVLRPHIRGWPDWGAVVVALLAFYPSRWALVCVQAQLLVNLVLAAALLAYGRGWRGSCGVLLGLASVLKPHFALLSVFGLLRREWLVTFACIGTVGVAAGVTVAILGWEPWTTYVERVVPPMSQGYAMEANQSLLGLLRRWVGDDPSFTVTPISPSVRVLGLVGSAALLIAAVVPRGRRAQPPVSDGTRMRMRSVDLGVAALAIMLASPIAWEHHFGWTIVLFAACYGLVERHGRAIRIVLGVSYVILGTSWYAVARGQPGPVSLLNSLPVFAALALLSSAWWLCRAAQGQVDVLSVGPTRPEATSC
jgi:hypothetical protein